LSRRWVFKSPATNGSFVHVFGSVHAIVIP
jgi:hypothetical protein